MAKSGFSVVIEHERFEAISDGMHEAIGKAVKTICTLAEHYAKTEHHYQNRTGNLEANTYAQPTATESGSGVAFEVGSFMFYAAYVEAWHAFLAPALDKALVGADDLVRTYVQRGLPRG